MKIVQILIGPNNQEWQGRLVGLGDDGILYVAHNGNWSQIFPAPEENVSDE